METSAHIQTVAVLVACIVYLAKQAIETYKYHERKKNGNGLSRSSLLLELHEIENTKELRAELKRNRKCMDELRTAIAKMNDSIVTLVAEIKNQHAALQRLRSVPHKGSKQASG